MQARVKRPCQSRNEQPGLESTTNGVRHDRIRPHDISDDRGRAVRDRAVVREHDQKSVEDGTSGRLFRVNGYKAALQNVSGDGGVGYE